MIIGNTNIFGSNFGLGASAIANKVRCDVIIQLQYQYYGLIYTKFLTSNKSLIYGLDVIAVDSRSVF